MARNVLTPLNVAGDFTVDDGGSFTTKFVYVAATTNRTIVVPNATGMMALVPGGNGQVVFNNLGQLGADASLTFTTTSGLRATNPIGYGTGGGGAVTQATSKATGVTLNKTCGQITTAADALAASTVVSFTLTNSTIAAGDVLILNHLSGGTAGAYMLNAQSAAGSASINIRNLTAGSLSEAIVIAYAVIKAVNS